MSAVTSAIVVATAIAATATAVTSTTATTLSGDDVDECLNLFFGGVVHAQYLTFKHEAHACIGVIEVDSDSLVLNLYHEAVHALTLSIHEGDYVARIDLLVIKLSIHAEDVLVNIKDEIIAAVTVGLVFSEGEVECVALLHVLELCLESFEGEAQTCGELEGMLGGSLFYEFFYAFELGIHVV